MVDIHLHSKFSFDSREEPENYLNAAKNRGIDILGFSEHYDYDAFLDGEREITLCDIQSYRQNLFDLRSSNPDLNILFGIELGYRKEAVKHYNRLISENKFDYVINSVHTLKGRGDCYHEAFFEGQSLEKSYREYLNAVLESINSDLDYDIVGHIGYVSRYRKGEDVRLEYPKYSDILDDILTAIIEKGKCLEVNTSRGTSGSLFLPDVSIIKRYISLGGKLISFGSDAHRAEDYLRNYSDFINFAEECGIEELVYFRQRKPIFYSIKKYS